MNPRVEKILKLPVYKRLIILAVIVGLVAGGFFYFLYLPQMTTLKDLQQKEAELETKLQRDRKIAADLPKFRDEYEKMQQRLKQALTELPNDREIPGLLSSIASMAKSHGLEIQRFQPGKEVPKGFYAEVPVQLKLVGPFHDFVLFSQAVGGLSRIVNLGSLALTPDSKSASSARPLLTVDCTATTFRFLETSEASQGKK